MVAMTEKGPSALTGSLSDLNDDFYSLMATGGFGNRLNSLSKAVQLIALLHLSSEVLCVGFTTLSGVLGFFLIPWVVVRTVLLLLFCALAFGEIAFQLWTAQVQKRLARPKPIDGRPRPPKSGMDVFQRTISLVEECASWPAANESTRVARSKVGVLPRLAIGRTPEEWLEGWFRGLPIHQIRRDNVFEFYAWAFFAKYVEELTDAEQADVKEMMRISDDRFNWQLKHGYNTNAKPIRIDFDPFHSLCKGLMFQLGTCALFAAVKQTMKLLGFKRYGENIGVSYYHRRLKRPASLILGGGKCKPSQRTPVVLIHGLGAGIAPYLPLIRKMYKTRELFVLELPEISQVGCEHVKTPDEMAKAIEIMLSEHGHTRAHFVGHSYGTVVMAWVIRLRRHLVEKAVFLDPICFLLAQPDVAFNFLYRPPKTAFAKLAALFIRYELYAAHVLFRNFPWYHNTLWSDEIPDDTTVLISGLDFIIDPCLTKYYLQRFQETHDPAGERVKLLWAESSFHGHILLSSSLQMQVVNMING